MRRIGPIVVIGLGILLILSMGAWIYLGNQIDHPSIAPLPDRLANLQLTTKLTGADATEEFSMLHDQHFPLTSGAVGIYGNNRVALWVGGAPLAFMAAQLVVAMRDKIAEGNSPFTPVTERQDGARTIYALEGMGQRHYYFQSKNMVIWLAAEPALADEALQQTLEAYP
jgi:hypothetical protein